VLKHVVLHILFFVYQFAVKWWKEIKSAKFWRPNLLKFVVGWWFWTYTFIWTLETRIGLRRRKIFCTCWNITCITDSFSSVHMKWSETVDTLRYSKIYRTERNEYKMFNFERFIVWFNILSIGRVNSSMIRRANTTSGRVNMQHNIWKWLVKNELKILLFGSEISIFDFDLWYFSDSSSILDFGTIFRFGFGFALLLYRNRCDTFPYREK